MESNVNNFSSKEQALIIACDKMRAEYQKCHFSPIEATITLTKNSYIGYGNQSCIDDLYKANIPTDKYQPLILVNIQTQNTDKHYTDLTKKLPLKIRQEILTIHEELFATTEETIKSLYSAKMTTEEMQLWREFLEISNHIKEHHKTLLNQVIPPFMPIHNLFSSVIKIKLFGTYHTTLLFDENQQQQLSQLLIKFYKTPQTITMLNAKTIKTINKKEQLLTLNDPANENEITLLDDKIVNKCVTEALETNTELEDDNIIHLQNQFDNPLTSLLLEDHIIIAPLIYHTHGANGSTKEKLRNDCLNDTLLEKKTTLLNYLNNREKTGK